MTIPMLFVFAIGYGLNIIIVDNSIIALGTKILIYTVIYSISVYIFAMNNYEKEIILKPINKILNRE